MLPRAVVLSLLAVAAHAANVDVIVGGSTLTYSPSDINPSINDTVTFHYHEKNHTATQTSFDAPCVSIAGGFDSGFMPVTAGATTFPTFTITINDTNPIYVYCRQQGHCQKGMVLAINAPLTGTGSFTEFQAAAIASGNSTTASSVAATTTTDAATSISSPPPPVVETVTATVTVANSVYTTDYLSWPGAQPNPTPDPQPSVYTITVGGGALTYSPPTATGRIGDTFVFKFQAKNHTVTQSTFGSPCNMSGTGFDSGFMPVTANATTSPTFNITINDTSPIWFYCRQPGPPAHCQSGMVGAINPPTTGTYTFNTFRQLAMQSNSSSSSSSSGSSTNSSSTSSSSGANRAVVSVGLGVGVVGFAMAALL